MEYTSTFSLMVPKTQVQRATLTVIIQAVRFLMKVQLTQHNPMHLFSPSKVYKKTDQTNFVVYSDSFPCLLAVGHLKVDHLTRRKYESENEFNSNDRVQCLLALGV